MTRIFYEISFTLLIYPELWSSFIVVLICLIRFIVIVIGVIMISIWDDVAVSLVSVISII